MILRTHCVFIFVPEWLNFKLKVMGRAGGPACQ